MTCACCAEKICLPAEQALLLETAGRLWYTQATTGRWMRTGPGRPLVTEPQTMPGLEATLRQMRREKLRILGESMVGVEADAYVNSPL